MKSRFQMVLMMMGVSLPTCLSGCTPTQMAGESPAYLIIDSLTASSGAEATTFAHTLQSDVRTNGSVLEDSGVVTFSLALKDPGAPTFSTVPSTMNFVTITRYRVRFVRADGRNAPAIDVPQAFDGAITLTVSTGGATGTFVLVRAQAKLEPPLVALRDLGGAIVLSTIAEVTFYGRDQAGRTVNATGLISVNFTDWADPQ